MTAFQACAACGRSRLVSPLHGDKGGPLVCMTCCVEKHGKIAAEKKEQARIVDAFGFGRLHAADGELWRELLDEAIRLCHPDRHPPERADLAKRVTAELLSLRPFTKPRPAPRNVSAKVDTAHPREAVTPAPRNASANIPPVDTRKPVTYYPCDICRHLIPRDYCDACRARHDAEWQATRERAAAAQRRYRARKRQGKHAKCTACGTTFWGRRKDARYCSPACRQKAHRAHLLQ